MLGLLATAVLTVVMVLARVVFGTAHAFAQTQNLTGVGIGNFTLPATGDMGSNIIDAIFGTGTSAQNLVTSGLGTMLAFFSNAVLIFAGITVLWIVISAVAETARTGVPFGKHFNNLWAPVRLVVALGLLVPLGSGLNSGQYIALSLAKWGSAQATTVWGTFAQKMIASNSGGGSPASSGLGSIPLNIDSQRQFADQMFQVVLCQQVSNAYADQCLANAQSSGNCPGYVNQNTVGTIYVGSTLANTSASGTSTPTPPANQPAQIAFYEGSGGTKATGGADCGAVTVTVPSGTAGPNAATTADQAILVARSAAAANFVSLVTPLARNLAQAAVQTQANGGSVPASLNLTSAFNQYQAAFNSYLNNETGNLSSTINTYNNTLNNGMVQTAQTYGWIYAPVWLASIATQNGQVMDASQTVPSVTAPHVETLQGTAANYWTLTNSWVQKWEPPNVSVNAPQQTTTFTSIANALLQMTSQVGSNNPLGQAGTYGRALLTAGFRIIEPPDLIDCYQNPFKNPEGCRYVLTEALMQSSGPGGWNGLSTAQVKQMILSGGGGANSYAAATGLANGQTFLPDQDTLKGNLQKVVSLAGEGTSAHSVLFPIGMIMISMGFILLILTLIPFTRFVLGILNWLVMVFEAVLAAPLVSLSLLRTDGEGFAPQQFQSSMVMLFGVVIRPILMTIGLVLGLIAFNAIMEIANLLFSPTIANLNPSSDNSYLSLGVYMIFYGTLAYTLANSAFKAIDLLPNFVMGWIGQRMESRVDDASAVQQQASGFMQTMAYSSRGAPDGTTAYGQQKSAEATAKFGAGTTGAGAAAGAAGAGQPAATYQAADGQVKDIEGRMSAAPTTPATGAGTAASPAAGAPAKGTEGKSIPG